MVVPGDSGELPDNSGFVGHFNNLLWSPLRKTNYSFAVRLSRWQTKNEVLLKLSPSAFGYNARWQKIIAEPCSVSEVGATQGRKVKKQKQWEVKLVQDVTKWQWLTQFFPPLH